MSATAKSTFAEKKAEAAAKVEAMHKALAADLVTGADWTRYLASIARFRRYSVGNIMLMWFQTIERQHARQIAMVLENGLFGGPVSEPIPELTQPAAFSTWSGMGGIVRKGEKALSVLAPVIITDKEKIDPATGKPAKVCVGFRLINKTFDIAQVEGADLPDIEPVQLLTGEGDEALWDGLVALAADQGFRVEIVAKVGSGEANGRCLYSDKLIEILASNERAQQVKTLAHEVAHMLLHGPADCPAFMPTKVIEVEAESVAFTLLSMLGHDSSDYSLGYVGTWSKGNGALVASTTERVCNAAVRILGFLQDGKLPTAGAGGRFKFADETDAALAA